MLSKIVFRNFRVMSKNLGLTSLATSRTFCNERKPSKQLPDNFNRNEPVLGDIGSKYQVFRDEDAEVILDVVEERQKYASRLEEELDDHDPFEGLNLEHGKNGVFEIEDLVAVLRRENGQDIAVVKVPDDIKYVDYICIVSGKSHRHLQALAQFVRRVYKQKKGKHDLVPKMEGVNSKDWLALDLGNIALHVLSKEARAMYDIEALWAVGREHDKEFTKQDPVVEMLQKHSYYLQDLQPAN